MGEDKIVELDDHRPMKPLFAISVYRKGDGTVYAAIDHADPQLFEETSELRISQRMRYCLNLLEQALPSIEEQASELVEEPTND